MNLSSCSDEALLLMARSENAEAYYALNKRYFDMRLKLCHIASAPLSKMFDVWDLNHAFFVTFGAAVKSFPLSRGGKFKSYLLKCLRNALIREAERLKIFKQVPTISLDNEYQYRDNNVYLHDVIKKNDEDPRMYVDYFEEAKKIGTVKKELPDEALKIAKLRIDGLTYREIGRILDMSIKQARYLFLKYESCLKKIVIGKIR